MSLVARDARVTGLCSVGGDARQQPGEDVSLYAVFDLDDAHAFRGLVAPLHAANFPQRIFADLVTWQPQAHIDPDASISDALDLLRTSAAPGIALVTTSGDFEGAVTETSLIDALLRQEQKLRAPLAEEAERRDALLAALPDEVFVLDASARVVESLDRGRDAMGARRASRLAQRVGEPLATDDEGSESVVREAVARCIERGSLESSGVESVSLRVTIADVERTHEIRFARLGPTSVLGVARDVSELASLKAQLLFADRLIAMGTLAAGVAHEINNPLGAVFLLLDALDLSLAAPDARVDARSYVADIRDAAVRIGTVVSDLRMLGRPDTGKAAPVDIARVLRASIRLARPQLPPHVRVVDDLASVPPVSGVEPRLGQVFVNLIANAVHAFAGVDRAEPRMYVRLFADADGVHIVVADNGRGLSPEARAHLFEAFFTTRPDHQGTGLGLHISHTIVTAHGGRLFVEDGIDGGCAFHIVLPIAQAEPETQRPGPPPSAPDTRVLVIDDDANVRRALARALPNARFTCDGVEGIEALAEEHFDVILCDMTMPHADGAEVYRACVARSAETASRFVLMTGASGYETVRQFVAESGVTVLEKPFSRATLYDVIRDVTARVPPQLAAPRT